MREIKFRVWDKDMKYMHVCGENVHDSMMFIDNVAYYYNLQNGCGSLPNGEGTYELMQYTGLKDRNGKEIYEGDIISIPEIGRYEVVFKEGCFGAEDGQGFSPFRQSIWGLGCEVIGNIYENRELIEIEEE